ncbi:outer membrane lipoprotein-sorting protein [bacterium]|nr:outer membrane lipoprotein-sorting protein [bacterium]
MRQLFIILFLSMMSISLVSEERPDIRQLIHDMDILYRSKTSSGLMEMKIETPNYKRTMRMQMWTEGLEKTFVVIESPKKDSGTASLRNDKEMWNFFPKSNKVMKIPPSMMMGSWMGSDFTNDDLVKQSTMLDDYTHSYLEPPKGDNDHYYIQLVPKKDTATVWGKIVIQLTKKSRMPVTQVYFNEKGKKVRIMTFSQIKMMGGKLFPTVMEIRPLTKKNRKTVITYISLEFDKKLPKNTFSLRNLRKKR